MGNTVCFSLFASPSSALVWILGMLFPPRHWSQTDLLTSPPQPHIHYSLPDLHHVWQYFNSTVASALLNSPLSLKIDTGTLSIRSSNTYAWSFILYIKFHNKPSPAFPRAFYAWIRPSVVMVIPGVLLINRPIHQKACVPLMAEEGVLGVSPGYSILMLRQTLSETSASHTKVLFITVDTRNNIGSHLRGIGLMFNRLRGECSPGVR